MSLKQLHNFFISVYITSDDGLMPKHAAINKLINTGILCDCFDAYTFAFFFPTFRDVTPYGFKKVPTFQRTLLSSISAPPVLLVRHSKEPYPPFPISI